MYHVLLFGELAQWFLYNSCVIPLINLSVNLPRHYDNLTIVITTKFIEEEEVLYSKEERYYDHLQSDTLIWPII